MAPFNFSEDVAADRIPLLPLFIYLHGPDTGHDPIAMARSCYRVCRLMVSWSEESRVAGGLSAVSIHRLDLAGRFRIAGREWAVRARGPG